MRNRLRWWRLRLRVRHRAILPVCWWVRYTAAKALRREKWAFRLRSERCVPWWCYPGVYIGASDDHYPMWKPHVPWWRYRNLHPTLEPKE